MVVIDYAEFNYCMEIHFNFIVIPNNLLKKINYTYIEIGVKF